MSSPVLNQDMILEILSHCPASDVGKSRLMNKECNKRSYESWFLNLNLQRTKSLSGYFVQYEQEGGRKFQTSFVHDMSHFGNEEVSIDFLPPGKRKIEAFDASHGILLCVNYTGLSSKPECYMVCKPTTKQYQIIPQSELKKHTVLFGLAVIQSNPFRYKILRLCRLRDMCWSRRKFACEVFDSGSFMWKRLTNLCLPQDDGLISIKPVQASGFLHWLSWDENVIRFCLETETWSFFRTPKFGCSPKLVKYEGKLGVIRWGTNDYGEDVNRLWVLNTSPKRSWVKVKDIRNLGLRDNILWTPSNDVVTLYSWDRFCFHNVNTEKKNIFQTEVKNFTSYVCFPFSSDYEKVDLSDTTTCVVKAQ